MICFYNQIAISFQSSININKKTLFSTMFGAKDDTESECELRNTGFIIEQTEFLESKMKN